MSRTALDEIQRKRLERLLGHASRLVPYYRERIDFRQRWDILDFPILKKMDVKENFHALMTPELRSEYETRGKGHFRYEWKEVKTGGATGIPTAVIHDREFRDEGRASRMYSQALCGFPFGTPYFRLWGSMAEINQMRDAWPQRVTRHLASETLLNAFQMSGEKMDQYLKVMLQGRARHIMAYIDAIHELARHAQYMRREVRPLVSIPYHEPPAQ